MLNNAGVSYNILTVLTHELSSKPEELFQFIKKNSFKYVQLIPCLPSLKGDEPTDRFALKPLDFANFYKKFFDLWYEEYQKGHYISVTLFDNVIPMYAGIRPEQCGMLGKCSVQTVVEGNGNVYPCDFYVLDEYCCGNVKNDSIESMIHHSRAMTFLNKKGYISKLVTFHLTVRYSVQYSHASKGIITSYLRRVLVWMRIKSLNITMA